MDQPDVMMGEPPKKGGGLLKWGLIGCGGLLLIGAVIVGIGVYWFSKNVAMDPAKVETAAQEILQFDKPVGFQGMMSMSIMGVKWAILAPRGSQSGFHSGIVLMSFPAGQTNPQQMQQQFREMMKQQGRGYEEVSEKRPDETFKVRDENVMAEVGVIGGKDSAEKSLQYTLNLKGAAGNPVLLTIVGPEAVTSHDWVQNFLTTVK